MFFKIAVDKNVSKSVGKPLGRCFFSSKFAGLHFTKKRLRDKCFLLNFHKFYKTFFYRTPPVAASILINAANDGR